MTNTPIDHGLEEFYLGFKQSMINFYNQHSITRPIEVWSDRLNTFQANQNYKKIHELIVKIISLYAIDIMRTCDCYNSGILETNIKRFNRVSKQTMEDGEYTIELIEYNSNIVFLLYDIFRSISKTDSLEELKPLFVQVELYLLYEDYTFLIEFAMKKNRLIILDKLFKYSPLIYRFALDLYNIPLETPGVYQTRNGMMSGRKFQELVRQYS
jgi:hypothetical protein